MIQIERSDHPHLLEWHSAHCVALAEICATPQAKKLLRLLAADLALEAEVLRRRARARPSAWLARSFRVSAANRAAACRVTPARQEPAGFPARCVL